MRKNAPAILLLILAFAIVAWNPVEGQDKKTGKITLQIEEDGKTVVDTVFDLREGQDPEHIKKMISSMTGEDVMIFSGKSGKVTELSFGDDGDENVWHMKHSMTDHDSNKVLHKDHMVMVYSDEDGNFTAKEMQEKMHMHSDIGIDLDSLKEAMGGGPVMVMKDEDGNITTKKLDGDEDLEWVSKDAADGHKSVNVWVSLDDEGGDEDVYIIKTDGGKHVKIVKDGTVHIHEMDGEDGNVKVIVTDEDGHTKVKTMTIKVEVEEDCDEENTEEKEVKKVTEEKVVKKKKKK